MSLFEKWKKNNNTKNSLDRKLSNDQEPGKFTALDCFYTQPESVHPFQSNRNFSLENLPNCVLILFWPCLVLYRIGWTQFVHLNKNCFQVIFMFHLHDYSPISLEKQVGLDEAVPKSNPNQFSNEIEFQLCKWNMKCLEIMIYSIAQIEPILLQNCTPSIFKASVAIVLIVFTVEHRVAPAQCPPSPQTVQLQESFLPTSIAILQLSI